MNAYLSETFSRDDMAADRRAESKGTGRRTTSRGSGPIKRTLAETVSVVYACRAWYPQNSESQIQHDG